MVFRLYINWNKYLCKNSGNITITSSGYERNTEVTNNTVFLNKISTIKVKVTISEAWREKEKIKLMKLKIIKKEKEVIIC
jgi:hypothetical protein